MADKPKPPEWAGKFMPEWAFVANYVLIVYPDIYEEALEAMRRIDA
jgi:hypothetical protein